MKKIVVLMSILLGCCLICLLAGGIYIAKNMAQFEYSEGYYLAKKGHYKEAVDKYTSAIKREPNEGIYYYYRAMAYEKSGDDNLAAKDKAKAEELGYQK